MEEDHHITVRFCWTRKPCLKVATIACSDRNILQSCDEPGGSGLG